MRRFSSDTVNLIMVAAALGGTVLVGACRPARSQPERTVDRSPPLVSVAEVVEEHVTAQYQLVGTATAIRRSTIGSPVEGRVIEVGVEVGELVRAAGSDTGDLAPPGPLVRLSRRLIDLDVAAARAELRRLEQRLAQLRAGSRPEEIARAEALLEAARASHRLAQARWTRARQLSELDSVSEEELETAQAVAMESLHQLAAAEANHALIVAGPRAEEVAQAEAEVEKQRQEVARLEVERERHTLFAPFDGFVAQKLVEVGEWLSVGDPVVELVDLDPIGVVVHVPETIVNQLTLGDEVPVDFAALQDGGGRLVGVIRDIAPSADTQARTFAVRIWVNNPQRDEHYLLRDGMQAKATIFGPSQKKLLVPKDAIVLGGTEPFVMTVRSGKGGKRTAARIAVELGATHGERIEVTGDLRPGQWVIVRGNERLRAGQVVRVMDGAGGRPKKAQEAGVPH